MAGNRESRIVLSGGGGAWIVDPAGTGRSRAARGSGAALDQRERNYQKVNLDASSFVIENNNVSALDELSIHVYRSPPVAVPKRPLSLLRSYLDVVMQGYLREFGEAGVAGFIETTKGFELQIHEDRQKPLYSRHQPISDDECAIFERFLPNQP